MQAWPPLARRSQLTLGMSYHIGLIELVFHLCDGIVGDDARLFADLKAYGPILKELEAVGTRFTWFYHVARRVWNINGVVDGVDIGRV